MTIIDITRELLSAPVYPGDPAPTATLLSETPRDMYNLTFLTLSAHTGTHIDAPRHFIDGADAIDALAPDIFIGECVVAEFAGDITAAELAPFLGETRLLMRGDITITAGAARAIAGSSIRLIGVESQSVGAVDAPAEVHLILLGAGVIPLEGLDLSRAPSGRYTLVALPLKIAGSDGSPTRAVLIN
ncbi:MAG: cyclase family protein [Oscillospiraceae bacterium]|jgi:arylformamidase|nr:cyclase family protein [Oscillospiraceae bacterium]